jgi:hypothetical protein
VLDHLSSELHEQNRSSSNYHFSLVSHFDAIFAVLVKLPKDCGEVVFVVSPGNHVQHLPKAVSVKAQRLLQHAKQEEA